MLKLFIYFKIVSHYVKIDGSLGGGRIDSPGPDNYDPDRSIKVVKDSSPEWT